MIRNNKKGSVTGWLIIVLIAALLILAVVIRFNWMKFKMEAKFTVIVAAVAVAALLLIVIIVKLKIRKARKAREKQIAAEKEMMINNEE